ncbi:glycosyltransferase family 4 protein [Blastococcus saxobsidens]|uniref:Glycosyltransferase family 4 protein n=1 Tax=Blastococcus saxobsidens TaxID=138336 RepID=A0A6L9VXM7_9ACTN|nr:glycosyltransferase family 4 protein [Blastococcus saxobsidens]
MTITRGAGPAARGAGRRVLHVVEKYSSGVGSAIAQYTRSLPAAEHFLLSTTAVDAEGDLAEQAAFAGTYRMGGAVPAKIRRIRVVVAQLRPDVVHAHSSHGGAFTRLALRRGRHRIVYTPHCYGFERRDVSWPVRAAFWTAEALLAPNTSVFAACSPRELALSRWPLGRTDRLLLPNVAPPMAGPTERPRNEVPVVAGGGRISPQKDPEFFAAAVRALRQELPGLRAVWFGDGDQAGRGLLDDAGVEVTGWLPRSAVLDELRAADLYLHSARWEGFPLMVAEATALGVPTLVRPVPSFGDVPGALRMGGAEDLAPALGCLRDPEAARSNTLGWQEHLAGNTVPVQAEALARVYRATATRG